MNVPEYWRCPKTHLENDTNYLANIPDKWIQGRYGPAQAKGKNAHAEKIIKKLKVKEAKWHPLKNNQPDKNKQEHRMCN